MYLVGSPHSLKADAQRLLEKLITDRERLVTDAEALKEILHGYVAIDRRSNPRSTPSSGVVDEMLSVDRGAVERAKQIVLGYRQLSAGAAVHLSVMEQDGIHQILSFDSGPDAFPGIAVPRWAHGTVAPHLLLRRVAVALASGMLIFS